MNEAKAREIAIQILDEFEELLAAKGISTLPRASIQSHGGQA